MEKHKKDLDKLCRICCNNIKVMKGYMNPKTVYDFVDVFKQRWNIEVENESVEVRSS